MSGEGMIRSALPLANEQVQACATLETGAGPRPLGTAPVPAPAIGGPIVRAIARWSDRYRAARRPNVTIGGEDAPYLRRWHVIPRNRFLNLYLHEVLRSDDDRALHDHPWWNVSLIIRGGYFEHVIDAGGIHRRTWRGAGAIKFRLARAAHRLEVDGPTVTLFLTGPRFRQWGFHCTRGWRHWRDFTAGPNGETVGRGCGELDDEVTL